ncbi:putative hydro-lyase [Lusitaniella coriacea]|uniref:putative hydro-lyase n=1 Tax=Lusitaniella coriacea TaxID=1983105 RepID=UPI003CE99237
MSIPTSPFEIRQRCRAGQFDAPTPGLVPGFVQANLVVLPYDLAFEFLVFCQRNPKPCPILDITEVGDPQPKLIAPGADIRTDLPRYRIFRHGELVEETTDIRPFWRSDLVGFLIGCSFSFENALLDAGLPVRHIEEGKNVPMYETNIDCIPTKRFSAPLVVSMRPLLPNQVVRAVKVTHRYHRTHGSPVHIGSPDAIGIRTIENVDYGDAVTFYEGEVPVFWACGVTTQTAIIRAKPEFAITHAPGRMFVSDLRDEDLTL